MSNRLVLLAILFLSSYSLVESRSFLSYQRSFPSLAKVRELRPIIERGLLNLCLKLERASNSIDSSDNTVIAPLSIAAIAALLLAGSGGITKWELEGLFGVQNLPHDEAELHRTLGALFSELETNEVVERSIAYGSGLFIQNSQDVNPGYLRLATELYRSEVIPVNFRNASYETSSLINNWVSNRTEGKIPTLLEDVVDPSTTLIIVNVFYFKGSWEQPFVEKFTKTQKFYVSDKLIIPVPMMVSMLNGYYGHVRGSHSVLGLPYKGGDITMYFVLPETDLRRFVNTLTPDTIRQFVNQTVKQQTIVAIPRMRVEGSLELSGPLATLGVASLFKPRSADLSSIGRGVYVDEMLHKVSIEVTETGTVGAAASAVTILRDGSTPLFRADRPFLFFIYHHTTGTILFWGTVFKPEPIESH